MLALHFKFALFAFNFPPPKINLILFEYLFCTYSFQASPPISSPVLLCSLLHFIIFFYYASFPNIPCYPHSLQRKITLPFLPQWSIHLHRIFLSFFPSISNEYCYPLIKTDKMKEVNFQLSRWFMFAPPIPPPPFFFKCCLEQGPAIFYSLQTTLYYLLQKHCFKKKKHDKID